MSTVQPVSPVTPSGRDDAADATSAEVILRSETFLLAIPFRTIANPGTRMQHPAARPMSSNLLGTHPTHAECAEGAGFDWFVEGTRQRGVP